jgi:hypothetical protein
VQLRTGKIGLRDFLFNIGVPEVTSAACSCGYERETPRHITVFCPRYKDAREQLRTNGHLDFREPLTTVEGVRKVIRWWLRRRVLEQFRLAEELIENLLGFRTNLALNKHRSRCKKENHKPGTEEIIVGFLRTGTSPCHNPRTKESDYYPEVGI